MGKLSKWVSHFGTVLSGQKVSGIFEYLAVTKFSILLSFQGEAFLIFLNVQKFLSGTFTHARAKFRKFLSSWSRVISRQRFLSARNFSTIFFPIFSLLQIRNMYDGVGQEKSRISPIQLRRSSAIKG